MLDAPNAQPLNAKELQITNIPSGYTPSVWEFFLPLILLIGISTGTYLYNGVPNVHRAFGAALVFAFVTAIFKGMSIKHAIDGITDGLKGVVVGSLVLLLQSLSAASAAKRAEGCIWSSC